MSYFKVGGTMGRVESVGILSGHNYGLHQEIFLLIIIIIETSTYCLIPQRRKNNQEENNFRSEEFKA